MVAFVNISYKTPNKQLQTVNMYMTLSIVFYIIHSSNTEKTIALSEQLTML